MNAAVVIDQLPTLTPERYPNAYVPIVPNGQLCPVTGLKHATLYRKLTEGEAAKHVRVVSLREPGAARGKCLFHAGDMLRWLDSLAAQQARERGEESEESVHAS